MLFHLRALPNYTFRSWLHGVHPIITVQSTDVVLHHQQHCISSWTVRFKKWPILLFLHTFLYILIYCHDHYFPHWWWKYPHPFSYNTPSSHVSYSKVSLKLIWQWRPPWWGKAQGVEQVGATLTKHIKTEQRNGGKDWRWHLQSLLVSLDMVAALNCGGKIKTQNRYFIVKINKLIKFAELKYKYL